MFVGVLRLALTIVGARSLKDKRRVVLSFKERAMSRMKVSAAEVGALDDPRRAILGVAVVANEAAHCDAVLEEVARVAGSLPDAILSDRASEIVPFGAGGRGLEGRFDALNRALGDTRPSDVDEGADDDARDDEEDER